MPPPSMPVRKAAPRKGKVAKPTAAIAAVDVLSSDDDMVGVAPQPVEPQSMEVDGTLRLGVRPGDPVYVQDWEWCDDLQMAVNEV